MRNKRLIIDNMLTLLKSLENLTLNCVSSSGGLHLHVSGICAHQGLGVAIGDRGEDRTELLVRLSLFPPHTERVDSAYYNSVIQALSESEDILNSVFSRGYLSVFGKPQNGRSCEKIGGYGVHV